MIKLSPNIFYDKAATAAAMHHKSSIKLTLMLVMANLTNTK